MKIMQPPVLVLILELIVELGDDGRSGEINVAQSTEQVEVVCNRLGEGLSCEVRAMPADEKNAFARKGNKISRRGKKKNSRRTTPLYAQ
jgi:hypothetical protein